MKITLRDMRFYACHGCYDTEQKVGGRFTVNLTVDYDGTKAAVSDNVAYAVNYLELYSIVKTQMMIPSHILENVARRTIEAIEQRFATITRIEIEIAKLAPPLGGDIQAVIVSLTSCR